MEGASIILHPQRGNRLKTVVSKPTMLNVGVLLVEILFFLSISSCHLHNVFCVSYRGSISHWPILLLPLQPFQNITEL